MTDKLNLPDLEISRYVETCYVHRPGNATIALEFDSIDEVGALLESITQCLQVTRHDFADAADQLRSSDAIGYAMQVRKLGELRDKLDIVWRA